jgi:hypothetical protein
MIDLMGPAACKNHPRIGRAIVSGDSSFVNDRQGASWAGKWRTADLDDCFSRVTTTQNECTQVVTCLKSLGYSYLTAT